MEISASLSCESTIFLAVDAMVQRSEALNGSNYNKTKPNVAGSLGRGTAIRQAVALLYNSIFPDGQAGSVLAECAENGPAGLYTRTSRIAAVSAQLSIDLCCERHDVTDVVDNIDLIM